MPAARFLSRHRHEPQLELSRLLKRRRMSLEKFIVENGIATYTSLTQRCNIIGVAPPTEQEYARAMKKHKPVTSHEDGIVVIEPVVPRFQVPDLITPEVQTAPVVDDEQKPRNSGLSTKPGLVADDEEEQRDLGRSRRIRKNKKTDLNTTEGVTKENENIFSFAYSPNLSDDDKVG